MNRKWAKACVGVLSGGIFAASPTDAAEADLTVVDGPAKQAAAFLLLALELVLPASLSNEVRRYSPRNHPNTVSLGVHDFIRLRRSGKVFSNLH